MSLEKWLNETVFSVYKANCPAVNVLLCVFHGKGERLMMTYVVFKRSVAYMVQTSTDSID